MEIPSAPSIAALPLLSIQCQSRPVPHASSGGRGWNHKPQASLRSFSNMKIYALKLKQSPPAQRRLLSPLPCRHSEAFPVWGQGDLAVRWFYGQHLLYFTLPRTVRMLKNNSINLKRKNLFNLKYNKLSLSDKNKRRM